MILFVLPPHSSHLTQPMDIGVFGPFKCMYNHECEVYKKNNPGISITKYSIAKLTTKPYVKAFSPENRISAFKRLEHTPLPDQLLPLNKWHLPYFTQTESVEQCQNDESDNESDSTINYSTVADNISKPSQQTTESNVQVQEACENFFSARNITVVKQRPKRKFAPPFVAGSLLKKTNQEILSALDSKKSKLTNTKAVPEKCQAKTLKLNKTTTQKSKVTIPRIQRSQNPKL